jgi:hypothetical protein
MSKEQSTSEPTQAVESIPFAEFLESVPPAQTRPVVPEVTLADADNSGRPTSFRLYIPQIQLHCPSDSCNGERFFRAEESSTTLSTKRWNYEYITYTCANCQKQTKTFAVAVSFHTDQQNEPPSMSCYKFGEFPPYGPPTPARLISLIGPDRELFLKGRRCENQGLGIGAFVYYRRVVEDQKNRIIGEIIKVAEVISAPPETIAVLKEAQQDHQFSNAIDKIRHAIPQRLLIAGQNPLTLLHSALSRGLHGQTDEKCVELATDIRLILAELSELLGHALKDERELKEAVSRLLRPTEG